MTKLHELLAAEKTPTAAWNRIIEETLSKFKNVSTYFSGLSRYLEMHEDSPANKAEEAKEREERPVTTTVLDTLEYAFGLFANSENLQCAKNSTNRKASATVMWEGAPFLEDMPVDELLGLEARLVKIKQLIDAMPTLDASKHWIKAGSIGRNIWESAHPDQKTKTEKTTYGIILAPPTEKHPAQVQAATKDVVVGKFTTIHRSGAITAQQKADAIQRVDKLMVEIKQARMRANETVVVENKIGDKIVDLLLEPLRK